MIAALEPAIIRVLNADGAIVGAGCLITNRHAVTCAHVVADALGCDRRTIEEPQGEVRIDFPFSQREAPILATVAKWYPMRDPPPRNGMADLALLELSEAPLPDAAPAQLADPDEINHKTVDVYGFRQGRDLGDWVKAQTQRPRTNRWLQFSGSDPQNYFIDHGFSGAPAGLRDSDRVVGLVSEVEPNAQEAFGPAVDVLRQAFAGIIPEAKAVTLRSSGLLARFHFGREKVIARVHRKYEPIYSNVIADGFRELNERKRRRGLEGYYPGQRYRPILPPVVSGRSVKLDLTPLNYAFVALMKDEEASEEMKNYIREQFDRIRLPQSLASRHPYFNAQSYNLLGVMICLVTYDEYTLLRRRGRSVLTGRLKWDVSVGGHPTPDDLHDSQIDLARTVQRETQYEIGDITGDLRKIIFTGLHRNELYGDIDIFAYWAIDNSASELRRNITVNHPEKKTIIFSTNIKAREAYVWDNDNLLVKFDGDIIKQALQSEGLSVEDLLPESQACLECALLECNAQPIGLNL